MFTVASKEVLLDGLDRAEKFRPELGEVVALLRELLAVSAGPHRPALPIALDEARRRLIAGEAILRDTDQVVDTGVLAGLERAVKGILAGRYRRDIPQEAIAAEARRLFLRAQAWTLAEHLGEVDTAPSFRCPVCGGEPALAALSKPDGKRLLLCGDCDTEWLAPRLGCPFCGCEEPSRFGYHPGEDPAYRLYSCDACRHYLRTVDHREQSEPLPLPVESWLTKDLDQAATAAGYQG